MLRKQNSGRTLRACAVALVAAVLAAPSFAVAQTAPPPVPQSPVPQPPTSQAPAQKPQTRITPQQAKQLFADVGQILQFASHDTKLPIRHQVKSRLITRAEVEKYLVTKMNSDKDAKRLEREEIVLRKFGLLDPDFQLRPFLIKLLDEQIAAFYDSKTKTVNLLDWIAPDQQKPVLAHELTHALQDQHVSLEKWENPTTDKISRTWRQDQQHVATDEEDTAREAVLEGQAMAVFVDYELAPMHRNLRNSPQMIEPLIGEMTDNDDGQDPILSRAPLLLQESLLFPYKYGLRFEARLMSDHPRDPSAAFADVLDNPPNSSFQIMNPRAYERHVKAPILNMPDIHPVIDAGYNPYDIGVMGELDVRIVSELFGGQQAAADLTPAWDGGIYYAAQKKNAPHPNSTSSVAIFYLSRWTSPAAAQEFAHLYSSEIGEQYSSVVRDKKDESGLGETIFQTNEGPVLISVTGNMVFLSESFPLEMARKLQFFMTSAQQQAGSQVAASQPFHWTPSLPSRAAAAPLSDPADNLVRFMARCGIMKAALLH